MGPVALRRSWVRLSPGSNRTIGDHRRSWALSSAVRSSEVTAAVKQEIEGAFAMIQSFDYTMDLSNLKLESSPTGRTYALAPTVVDMKLGDMKMRSKGVTLAMMDEGQWYLLNPSDEATIGLIKETFPDLAAVTIKPNPIEVVQ